MMLRGKNDRTPRGIKVLWDDQRSKISDPRRRVVDDPTLLWAFYLDGLAQRQGDVIEGEHSTRGKDKTRKQGFSDLLMTEY